MVISKIEIFLKSVLFVMIVAVIHSRAEAARCNSGDQESGGYTNIERQSCFGSGYCHAVDYNPATGRYEDFYGYHSNCQGHQERQIETVYCRRPSGTTYTVVNSGWWGGCQFGY